MDGISLTGPGTDGACVCVCVCVCVVVVVVVGGVTGSDGGYTA